MSDEPQFQSQSAKQGTGESVAPPFRNDSNETIAALRKRVVSLKETARLLLERFERHEISQAVATAESLRLEQEVVAAEADVKDWEREHRGGTY
jgi:hypothetical protein